MLSRRKRFNVSLGVMRLATVGVLALSMLILAGPVAAVPAASKTLDNLMVAFNGESNAHAKYVEFAKKAESEGYLGVASLFKAAAKAEEIHAARHAEVIKKLGGTPKAEIKLPEIKSTAENLKAALDGETYERDKMYPEFIAQAKAENNKAALRAFNFAVKAEAQHAVLYAEASGNLEKWKVARGFMVCPECGNTVLNVDFKKCPVCFTPAAKFLPIS